MDGDFLHGTPSLFVPHNSGAYTNNVYMENGSVSDVTPDLRRSIAINLIFLSPFTILRFIYT